MTLEVWDMQVSEPRIEDLEQSLGTAASQSPCGLIPAPWPPATAGVSGSLAWCAGLSALVVLPQWKTGIAETKGGESCFLGSSPSLHPLEWVQAQSGIWVRAPGRGGGAVQEAAGRTHLDGPLPNDLAQLGNVVILLNGCPKVPVVIGLDRCWFTPKCSLGRGDISWSKGRSDNSRTYACTRTHSSRPPPKNPDA